MYGAIHTRILLTLSLVCVRCAYIPCACYGAPLPPQVWPPSQDLLLILHYITYSPLSLIIMWPGMYIYVINIYLKTQVTDKDTVVKKRTKFIPILVVLAQEKMSKHLLAFCYTRMFVFIIFVLIQFVCNPKSLT